MCSQHFVLSAKTQSVFSYVGQQSSSFRKHEALPHRQHQTASACTTCCHQKKQSGMWRACCACASQPDHTFHPAREGALYTRRTHNAHVPVSRIHAHTAAYTPMCCIMSVCLSAERGGARTENTAQQIIHPRNYLVPPSPHSLSLPQASFERLVGSYEVGVLQCVCSAWLHSRWLSHSNAQNAAFSHNAGP